MKTCELNSINRFYFGYEEIFRALKIRPASSARVSASHYVMSNRRAPGCHFKRSGRRRILCPSISRVVFKYVSFAEGIF